MLLRCCVLLWGGMLLWCSVLLWCNRRTLLRRWNGLVANPAPRFADRLDALRRHAQVFIEPVAAPAAASGPLAVSGNTGEMD